jgi:hypothetical protein
MEKIEWVIERAAEMLDVEVKDGDIPEDQTDNVHEAIRKLKGYMLDDHVLAVLRVRMTWYDDNIKNRSLEFVADRARFVRIRGNYLYVISQLQEAQANPVLWVP